MSEDKFLDLQNGFYNALSQGLGYPVGSPFQLFQPSPPLVSAGDQDQILWAYFNNIPVFSLTQNYVPGGGSQFFSNYKGLLSALKGGPNKFKETIGQQIFEEWGQYVTTVVPPPTASQLPQLFFSWAILYYPQVAGTGASALAQTLLDPVLAAQLELMAYLGAPPKIADWTQTYADLLAQLAVAPSREFFVSTSTMNSDVSKSWTKGSNRGIFGLWGGSSSSSTESRKFSSSGVSVSGRFGHVTPFQASPGAWYNSAAMGLAYATESGSPWDPDSSTNWKNTFDAASGNLARFTSSLIVVDTMEIVVQSQASFSTAERETIDNNKSAGMWPFYSSGSSSGSSTDVTFDNRGQMSVKITSDPRVPVVIGCLVLPVNEYVGHGAELAQLLQRLLDAVPVG